MNSKIAMSTLSIVTSLALMGGTAFAAFVSTATATGNTFSTGNADLQISTNAVDYGPSISNFFSGTDIFPGDSRTYTFYLKNNSADNLTLNIDASFTDGSGDTTLQDALITDFACDNGADPAAFSVTSMLGGSVDLGNLNSGAAMTCTLTVSLPASADDSVAGQTIGFNALFNATQP